MDLQGDELRRRLRRAAIRNVQAMVRQYIPDESRSLPTGRSRSGAKKRRVR
jgi:hypothetical protein